MVSSNSCCSRRSSCAKRNTYRLGRGVFNRQRVNIYIYIYII